MKKQLIHLIVLVIGLYGCTRTSTSVEVNGEIKGLERDTLYIYGNDELSDFIIPVPVIDNKFSVSIPTDTLTQAILFIDDRHEYPIYLEKGKTIQIKGNVNDLSHFEVKGSKLNEEMTAFNKGLSKLLPASDSLYQQKIEAYIHQHQKSLINIYLLDKYFVQTPTPDVQKIKQLISVMDGTLQDKPYIAQLSALIESTEKAELNKIAPAFTLTTSEGKRISRSEFRDQYLLLTFWASWSDSCNTSNKELKKIRKMYPKKKKTKEITKNKDRNNKEKELSILAISLDLDRSAWKAAIKQDTLDWDHATDFNGWNSDVVKQYGINEIPYNILLDTRGTVIAKGISGEVLEQKLDSLLKKDK